MVRKNKNIARGDPGGSWGIRLRIRVLSLKIGWLNVRLHSHLLLHRHLRQGRHLLPGGKNLQGSRSGPLELKFLEPKISRPRFKPRFSELKGFISQISGLKSERDSYAQKPLTPTRR
jgi:hypothetical protein